MEMNSNSQNCPYPAMAKFRIKILLPHHDQITAKNVISYCYTSTRSFSKIRRQHFEL